MEVNNDNFDDPVDKGLFLLKNLKLSSAEQHFQSLLQNDPQFTDKNLWIHFHYAEVLFYKSLLTEDKELMEHAAQLGFQLEEKAEKLAAQNADFLPKNVFANLFSFGSSPVLSPQQLLQQERIYKQCHLALAELYLGFAIMRLRQLAYMKGAYYLRKSYKAYEALLAILNDNDDKAYQGRVKFGVGVFHFIISLVPSTFVWIVEFVGFHADRSKALVELEYSRESKCKRSVESTIMLALFNGFFLDNKPESDKMLSEVLQQYPNAGIYKMLAAMLERRNGSSEQSILYLRGVVEDAKEARQLQLTAEYELAHSYFMKNEWTAAIPGIEQFLRESKSPNFRAYGGFKVGFCYWMTNQHDKIEDVYKKVPGWVRPNFSFDRYALRKVTHFMQLKKYTKFDEISISAFNLTEGRYFSEALTKIEEISDMIAQGYDGPEVLHDCWGMYHYLKGCCQRGLKQYDDAKKSFAQVFALDSHLVNEKFVVPHAYCEMGELIMEETPLAEQTQSKAEAKDYFLKAKHYPQPYDFDKPLGLRISKGLQRVAMNKG